MVDPLGYVLLAVAFLLVYRVQWVVGSIIHVGPIGYVLLAVAFLLVYRVQWVVGLILHGGPIGVCFTSCSIFTGL